eukprot:scaffold14938_cov62-Skeletonema_dohrnii-CCMP3373.AAC.1
MYLHTYLQAYLPQYRVKKHRTAAVGREEAEYPELTEAMVEEESVKTQLFCSKSTPIQVSHVMYSSGKNEGSDDEVASSVYPETMLDKIKRNAP